ncbi:MAG TPA: glycogen-binding domain-containing protein [Gemmatimonadales bacterium]|nr:glycogen-binding domain-containing protein [Gemmatimonadales bacterium]
MTDRLDDAIELLRAPPAMSVESRVMAEVRRISGEGPLPMPRRRVFTWPRFATLGLALAAGLAAILLIPRSPETLTPGESEGIAQFVGHFPGARSVEVVGSFNNWSRGLLHLRDENHDGIWHAAAVLPAGQHEYMFVVDGERWVTDPLAGRFVDDGFDAGRENSVLIVRPAGAVQR